MDVRIQMPNKVKTIIRTLQEHGYEAYAVGGCVRDSLLNQAPEDWDITTSATPEEMKSLFFKTIDTGIKHGTITVLLGKETFEVTTYRIDGKYEDGRHPREVKYTRSLKEDLLRRDFTINAMAYNEKDGLVDIFGGMDDLKAKKLRCVGDAKKRLSEDALRILRGIRFSAQLGFSIETATRNAMRELSSLLKRISAERIQAEFLKILLSPRPDMLREAYLLGITKEFIPEFDILMETEQETPHHMYTVGEHTLHALLNVRADKVLRLTMLFHDIGKPALKTIDEDGVAHFKQHPCKSAEIAEQVLRRLKFDNDTIRAVTKLVYYHDCRTTPTQKNVRKALNRIGEELFPLYLEVRRADMLAQSTYLREEKMRNIDETEAAFQEILRLNQCTSLKTLAVTGKDLIDAGMSPGKELGEMLQKLLELVIDDPELNTKEALLKYI